MSMEFIYPAELPVSGARERLGNPFYLELLNAVNETAADFQVTTAVASSDNSETLLENVTRMCSTCSCRCLMTVA